MTFDPRPIGVFDSGIGGLTVLRAMQMRMPSESMIYLGDTARLPYGTKSSDTVQRYAVQAASALIRRRVKLVVIACNTASASAIEHLRAACFPIPVVGVIQPGAIAAAQASRSGRIAVLSTEATARSGAYPAAIKAIRSGAQVTSIACPLLVALAEEGWTDGPVPEAIVRRYVEPVLHNIDSPDCFVLGCTHFPLLRRAIQNVVGPAWTLIDSGTHAAEHVQRLMEEQGLTTDGSREAYTRFMVTDGPERFARLASGIFGYSVSGEEVETVDLLEAGELPPLVAPAA